MAGLPPQLRSPSSVQSVHPCQSVILTSGGSRGYACLAGRRELGGYVLGGYVLGGYEGKPIREDPDSPVLQPPRRPGFSIFREIPSSVKIRDSDKWNRAACTVGY